MNKEMMKKIESLKNEYARLKTAEDELIAREQDTLNELARKGGLTKWFEKNIFPSEDRRKEIDAEISRLTQMAIEPGDGVTIRLYTDREAYTVIRRTAKTATIRRCKATLNREKSHLEFTPGGFLGHTEGEQVWDYEEDPKGDIKTIRWSEARGCFLYKGKYVQIGRHEFYDYNF